MRIRTSGLATALAAVAMLPSAALAIDGIGVEAAYTAETWALASGGIDPGVTYLDNVDLVLEADLGVATGWQGATLFLYGLTNNAASFTEERVGDMQTVSNIDNDRSYRLFEAWLEQRFADDVASLKVGLIDLNSEFDAIDTAGLFINSSYGIGPDFSQSGENGPSIFPNSSLGARLDWQTTDAVVLRAGVFDGVPNDPNRPKRNAIKLGDGDGVLLVFEGDITPSEFTRIGLGYWVYTAKFEALAGDSVHGNDGAYAFIDRRLWSEADAAQGLNAWVRYGVADKRINALGSYFGIGAVYTGVLPGRDADALGLAIAIAGAGGKSRASAEPVDRRELNVELTYRLEATPWLALQSDVQWVKNPGLDPNLGSALAIGLRAEVAWGWGGN